MTAARGQWHCDRDGGKLIYTSPRAAEFALDRIRKLREAGQNHRREASSYLCRYTLDHWHLTSMTETYDRRELWPGEIELAVGTLQRSFGQDVTPAERAARRRKLKAPVVTTKGPSFRPPPRVRGPAGIEWADAELTLLFQGLSSEEIAQATGRSVNMVRRKAVRLLSQGQWVDVSDSPAVQKFREAARRDCDVTPAERAYLDGARVMPTKPRNPPLVPGDGDPRHGRNGYGNLGCRCPICRAGNTAAQAESRAKPRTLPTGDPRHGTSTAIRYWHCTCDICRPPKPEKPTPKPIPEDWLTITQAARLLGITRERVRQLKNDDRLWPFTAVNGQEFYLRSEVEDMPSPRLSYKVTGRGGKADRPAEAMTLTEAAKFLGLSVGVVRRRFKPYLTTNWVTRADVYAYKPPQPGSRRRRSDANPDMAASGYVTAVQAARQLRLTTFRVRELFELHYASERSRQPWVKLTDVQAYRPPPPPVLPVGTSTAELLAAARARRARKG